MNEPERQIRVSTTPWSDGERRQTNAPGFGLEEGQVEPELVADEDATFGEGGGSPEALRIQGWHAGDALVGDAVDGGASRRNCTARIDRVSKTSSRRTTGRPGP